MFSSNEGWPLVKFLTILIFTILTVIATPLILLITSLTLILRQTGKFYAYNFHKDSKHIFKIVNHTSQIIARDYLRPNPRFNIVSIWLGKGKMSIAELRQIVESKVVEKKVGGKLFYPELQCHTTTICGYDFWKYNSQFSINDHVREINLEGKKVTRQQLKEVCAKSINSPWKKGRSPWEFLLVDNYVDGEGSKVVVIFRHHHFLADGYCILKLLKCLNTLSKDKITNKGLTEQRSAATEQHAMKNLLRKTALILSFPYHTALLLEKVLRTERSLWKVPSKNRNQIGQNMFQDWSQPVSVETIKSIKNKHEVSFTSVLLSLFVTAMHNLTRIVGQKNPETVSAILMAPVPGHPGGLSNHFGYAVVRLPTGEKDPVRRLQMVERELNSLKTSMVPLISHMWYSLAGLFPPSITWPGLSIGLGYSVALSILAGAGSYDWGNCKESHTFYTIGTGQGDTGACFTSGSQNGLVRVTLTIDRLIFPSEDALRKFNEIVQTEIATLLTAVRAE